MSNTTKNTTMKKNGKTALVPKLRFPEFRGKEGWEEKPLANFLSESRLPGSKGNVAKKITVKLWGNGVFEKNDAIQGSINTQYYRRKAGQFIYSKLDFLNQAFGIIPPSLDNFESTVDLPCFDIVDGLNPVFLLEYVKRRDFYEKLGETADGSRKARRIHADTFLSFPIALPSPAEQQKIAECLSSMDELMAAQARKVEALKTHKKGLMQQLFPREGETQPRLRFPEFQDSGEWKQVRLDGFSRVIRGSSPRPQGDPRFFGGPVPRLMVQDVTRDGKWVTPSIDSLTEEGATLSRPCPAGTLTIVCSGVVGIVSFLAVDACIHDGFLALVDIDESKANKDFLFHTLSTLRSQFERGATHGGVFTNLTTQGIKEFVIHCPEIGEQQRIADCLTSLDELITAEAQKLEALKTHKKGLMQQLFPSPGEVEA
ncbi:MAG: restriction endonuclease subunit S [Rheinheimera sp.]|nr:restriction endonuclease subunit S [Rheinheimera sp.]